MSAGADNRPVHRLVTFLGTGNYQETIYQLDNGKAAQRTPYVCRALAELFAPTEIAVLATEEAEKAHGDQLKDALRSANSPSPRFVEIPKGERASELWEQFQLIKDELRGSNGPVMFDITHGFRSQPFFAAAISAFIRAVDETPPDLRICYAAYEARDEAGLAPIWELTEFVALLDWAQALRMFLRTGRAEEAAAETKRLGAELAKIWALSGQSGQRPNLDELGKAMEAFGLDLGTLRTGDLLIGRGGKRSSAANLREAAQRAKEDAATHVRPLADVLDRVIAMAEPLAGERDDLSGDGGRKAVVALAELYLRLGRYLEAAATVREGWVNFYAAKTALCPGADGFDKEERDRAEKRAGEYDNTYREVTDRRNDFLHAQYRASAQKAADVISTAERLVEKLEAASQAPRGSSFVNLSNHPSNEWDEAQRKAVLALAERIEDMPFPSVPPDADEKAIKTLAEECMSKVPSPTTHALIQGEFTLTFELVRRLQARRIVCFAATSERQVEEASDGRKTSTFGFVRLREYPWLGGEVTPSERCRDAEIPGGIGDAALWLLTSSGDFDS